MGRGRHVKPPRAACIERLWLRLDGDLALLSTFPAELQNQARAFHGDRSRVARVLELTSSHEGTVRPNGHFSYGLAAPERLWSFKHGSLDAEPYLRQWQEDLGHLRSYPRESVATRLWPCLVRRRMGQPATVPCATSGGAVTRTARASGVGSAADRRSYPGGMSIEL
jgi:hypothetical protein